MLPVGTLNAIGKKEEREVKKGFLMMAMVGGILLCVMGVLYAAAPEVIPMENKAYPAHTKGIVQFSHAKHMNDYAKAHPDLNKDGCGACHHDENGKPLTGLKDGDPVKGCIECHKNPGQPPKEVKQEWKDKKIEGAEKDKLERQWHAEALHQNCWGCHKEVQKATGKKDAPTVCTKCHVK